MRKVKVSGVMVPLVDVAAFIRELGNEVEKGQEETYLRRAIVNAWRKAAMGNDRSLLIMLEYGFGKPGKEDGSDLKKYFMERIQEAGITPEQIEQDENLRLIARMIGYEIKIERKTRSRVKEKKEIPIAATVSDD